MFCSIQISFNNNFVALRKSSEDFTYPATSFKSADVNSGNDINRDEFFEKQKIVKIWLEKGDYSHLKLGFPGNVESDRTQICTNSENNNPSTTTTKHKEKHVESVSSVTNLGVLNASGHSAKKSTIEMDCEISEPFSPDASEYLPDSTDTESEDEVVKTFSVLSPITDTSKIVLSPKKTRNCSARTTAPNKNLPEITNLRSSHEKRKWKKVVRRSDFCYFCESAVLNFARHITRSHQSEMEVQKILALPTKSQTRRNLIAVLRKRGNHIRNVNGCVKPVKRSHVLDKDDKNYIPCKYCLGYYRPKQLWRHVKQCKLSKSSKTDFSHQTDSQNILVKYMPIDPQLKETVFPRMLADKVSLVAKTDLLICQFGTRYLKTHREKHLINVCSRKMRELAKLLIEIKTIQPLIQNLYDALQPVYFDLFVQSTKIVAKYDSTKEIFASPTYAMNIQTSLKQCCDIAILLTLKRKYNYSTVPTAEAEANFKTFKQLLGDAWRFEISTIAAADLNVKKWNKLTILPLATDLKLFRNYLLKKAEEAIQHLKSNENSIKDYKLLMETIFCRLILLNRKRIGELERMPLHVYIQTEIRHSYEEFSEAITPTEKVLLQKFKRVVIRGKRGRGVPVLFSDDLQEHMAVLIYLRSHFVDDSNTFLFAKFNTNNPITGYKILEKHVKLSGVKNPGAITSTRLRKHLATLTQIFNMSPNDIEQLATFMGHTNDVHKQVYRLPDDVYQTAKISKLLLLMEKGKAAEYKGKALDEIELDLEEEIELEEDEGEDIEPNNVLPLTEELIQTEPYDESQDEPSIPSKKTRTLVPWTTDQKTLVKKFFHHHIRNKIPPKKGECEKLKSDNPNILNNKTWPQIKVFVQNIYRVK